MHWRHHRTNAHQSSSGGLIVGLRILTCPVVNFVNWLLTLQVEASQMNPKLGGVAIFYSLLIKPPNLLYLQIIDE